MQDNFVRRDEFLETIHRLDKTTLSIEQKLDSLLNSFMESKIILRRLHKQIFESNGGESMVDQLNRVDAEFKKVKKYVDAEQKKAASRWKMLTDNLWKYFIRFVVLVVMAMFVSLFLGDPDLLVHLIKSFIK